MLARRAGSAPRAPRLQIEDDVAICEMGVYPDELFRIRNEIRFLPEIRRETCEEKLGYTSPQRFDPEEYAKRRAAVKTCAAEMKAKGLP